MMSIRALLQGFWASAVGDRRLSSTKQLSELKKQIPSLYGLLSVNAIALAITHYSLAPTYLTVAVPGLLVLSCLFRIARWRRMEPSQMSELEATRKLNRTIIVTTLFTVPFSLWGMSLYEFGGPNEHGHVTVFAAITVIGCVLCLTHLPVAAYLMVGLMMVLFLPFYIAQANLVSIAIAINVALVIAVIVRVVRGSFESFAHMVEAQSEADRLHQMTRQQALTDSLTNLPNRRQFFEKLQDLCANERSGYCALALFDLDRFKPINDTFGHQYGDIVLIEIGRRLNVFARTDIIVGRLGGDEFGLIVSSEKAISNLAAFCRSICDVLQQPIHVGGFDLTTSCTCGAAETKNAFKEGNKLFERADYALYYGKDHFRNDVTVFSNQHERELLAEQAIETGLRSAKLADELSLAYQPIADIATGRITAVEALARWRSPALGDVPPGRFISAAERCGIMHALTMMLLGKLLQDSAAIPSEIGVSFNLSAHDLSSHDTVMAIVAAVRASDLDPRRLTFELTETALIRDFELAQRAIKALKDSGAQIALDDFGTGYSSFSYLHQMSFDKIKIDRSFVSKIDTNHGRRIIASIADLCHGLGLVSIVEGIETAEQLAAVKLCGCLFGQGYYIGRPISLYDLQNVIGPQPINAKTGTYHAR